MQELYRLMLNFYQILLNPFRRYPDEYYYRAPGTGDVIGMVWPWIMLQAIYELIGIRLAHMLWQEYGPQSWSESPFLYSYSEPANISIFNILIGLALYPVLAYFLVKTWEVLIQMSLDFIGKKNVGRERVLATIHHTFASNIFLVIPFIGGVIQKFAAAFFLFAGLVGNLQLSKLQALFVVLLPLIFAGLLLVFTIIVLGLQLAMP